MEELAKRRKNAAERTKLLRAKLGTAEDRVKGKACVYATGSFGRQESSSHSDLDLFIVGKNDGNPGRDDVEKSLLNHLDEICVKADLIQATRDLGIPDFDGDGRYLVHYSVHELVKTLGTPEDDATNTFTARLLLLLESTPLLETAVHSDIVQDVIAAYWIGYEDHRNDFRPGYLANDILRLWRTFCVNYEARTETQPENKRIKRKTKNYKLKYSRLLTCYSALLYLLAIYGRQNSVHPSDAMEMIRLTPTARLEWLLAQSDLKDAHASVDQLLSAYDSFLQQTNVPESELVALFSKREAAAEAMAEANRFGDLMFEALTALGRDKALHRLIVV